MHEHNEEGKKKQNTEASRERKRQQSTEQPYVHLLNILCTRSSSFSGSVHRLGKPWQLGLIYCFQKKKKTLQWEQYTQQLLVVGKSIQRYESFIRASTSLFQLWYKIKMILQIGNHFLYHSLCFRASFAQGRLCAQTDVLHAKRKILGLKWNWMDMDCTCSELINVSVFHCEIGIGFVQRPFTW